MCSSATTTKLAIAFLWGLLSALPTIYVLKEIFYEEFEQVSLVGEMSVVFMASLIGFLLFIALALWSARKERIADYRKRRAAWLDCRDNDPVETVKRPSLFVSDLHPTFSAGGYLTPIRGAER